MKANYLKILSLALIMLSTSCVKKTEPVVELEEGEFEEVIEFNGEEMETVTSDTIM
jgi:hypothetical protein